MFGFPYHTFPYLQIGSLHLQVFGLCVAIGVIIGTVVAGQYARRHDLSEDHVIRIAPWLVLAGVVGARLTYVITNFDELGSFWDAFAIWKGGLQFTGGVVLASLVALPMMRRLEPTQRWVFADTVGLGLIIGQAIGMLVILSRRSLPPCVLIGVFCLWYGVLRFATDFLRVTDRELFGLTGAQYGCLVLIGIGTWVIASTRGRVDRLAAIDPAGIAAADSGGVLVARPASPEQVGD